MRDPWIAGVLSFFIPGLGQLYNGRVMPAFLCLNFALAIWFGTGGTLGWICHFITAYLAYYYAKENPVRPVGDERFRLFPRSRAQW